MIFRTKKIKIKRNLQEVVFDDDVEEAKQVNSEAVEQVVEEDDHIVDH
jgi:hypothetical protein